MVKLNLHWSREHIVEFSKQIYNQLLNDKVSDYFGITIYLDGCNIQIEDGEVNQ